MNLRLSSLQSWAWNQPRGAAPSRAQIGPPVASPLPSRPVPVPYVVGDAGLRAETLLPKRSVRGWASLYPPPSLTQMMTPL